MIDQGTPFEEEPLPEALRRDNMSLLTRILCFCALGRPDLEAHWRSLQSEKAFEIVRTKVSSILDNVITTVSYLTSRELKPALTYSTKGGHPPRYKWCIHHYELSFNIL